MFASVCVCVCVCVSDDSVSFMSEFHEVWYPDMIGWVSGCGQFHIESSKLSPRRGVVNARRCGTQRRILSLVPIIVAVVVECCCFLLLIIIDEGAGDAAYRFHSLKPALSEAMFKLLL